MSEREYLGCIESLITLVIFWSWCSVPGFGLFSRCVCMKVSGGVPRVPSTPDGVKNRRTASPTSTLLWRTRNCRTLSSIVDDYRDWPSLITPIPGGILDSTPKSEQRARIKTFGRSGHATRTPTTTRACDWGFEVCWRRNVPPREADALGAQPRAWVMRVQSRFSE